MTLVEVENESGEVLYLNPEHVVMLKAEVLDTSSGQVHWTQVVFVNLTVTIPRPIAKVRQLLFLDLSWSQVPAPVSVPTFDPEK